MTKLLAVCPACDQRIGCVSFDMPSKTPMPSGAGDVGQWTSVKDRMPEYPWPVLVFAGRHVPPVGADQNPFVHDIACWRDQMWYGTRFRSGEVTHWRNLPPAP